MIGYSLLRSRYYFLISKLTTKFFFSNRVINKWNMLREETIAHNSLSSFKRQLDHHLRDDRGFIAFFHLLVSRTILFCWPIKVQSSNPGGMQGWADLVGWLHGKIGWYTCLKTVHPTINKAGHTATSFMCRITLTTTTRRQSMPKHFN